MNDTPSTISLEVLEEVDQLLRLKMKELIEIANTYRQERLKNKWSGIHVRNIFLFCFVLFFLNAQIVKFTEKDIQKAIEDTGLDKEIKRFRVDNNEDIPLNLVEDIILQQEKSDLVKSPRIVRRTCKRKRKVGIYSFLFFLMS
jgi:hypothetical protein